MNFVEENYREIKVMAGAADLPTLPEGQESYAGIPKAVFVVRNKLNSIGKSFYCQMFYNQQNISDQMILIFQFSALIGRLISGRC